MRNARTTINENLWQFIILLIGLLTALVTLVATIIEKFVEKRTDAARSKPTVDNGYERYLLIELTIILVACIIYLIIVKRKGIKREREIKNFLDNLNLHIDEKPLMSINSENLYRVLTNDDFRLERSVNTVTFRGPVVKVEFDSMGTRLKDNNPGYVFNIGLDGFIPYDKLECISYDLKQDPHRQFPIRPLLKSKDSSFKQVMVPFSNRVALHQHFHVYIFWESALAISPGIDYHGCTLFHSESTFKTNQTIVLKFMEPYPKWVRVYEPLKGKMELIKPLNAYQVVDGVRIYTDEYPEIELKRAIVYLFER